MRPPLLKAARKALRQLFRSAPQPAPLTTHTELAMPEPVLDLAEPSVSPALDIEPHQSIFSLRPRQPKRVDLRFSAKTYRGSRDRHYRLFVPSSYHPDKPMPLVMVLHGCHQTHMDIEKITSFNQLAEREGFLVLYPFVTGYGGLRAKNCWGWWLASQIRAGAGEVEDLHQMLAEVQQLYAVDGKRIHVTGLSSGAGMAVALMVTHGRTIASGCSVAGVAYGESSQAVQLIRQISPHYKSVAGLVRGMEKQLPAIKPLVPIFIVHSRDDSVVNIKAAKNLRDSWAQCFGVSLQQKSNLQTGESGDSRWQHARYSSTTHSGSNKLRSGIETLWLDGPGHGWCGGQPGSFSFPDAINLSEHIWAFFKAHAKEID